MWSYLCGFISNDFAFAYGELVVCSSFWNPSSWQRAILCSSLRYETVCQLRFCSELNTALYKIQQTLPFTSLFYGQFHFKHPHICIDTVVDRHLRSNLATLPRRMCILVEFFFPFVFVVSFAYYPFTRFKFVQEKRSFTTNDVPHVISTVSASLLYKWE